MRSDIDYIQNDFITVERLYNAEFNRDWNIETPFGNQTISELGDQVFITTGAKLQHPERGELNYQFQHLNFNQNYDGNRHLLLTKLKFDRFQLVSNSSV